MASTHPFLTLTALISLLIARSWAQTGPCPEGRTLSTLLKDTGIPRSRVGRYSKLFQKQGVDIPLLKTLTTAKLQEIGIKAFGDAFKISRFFNADTANNCKLSKNPCIGGKCVDDYKCFRCECAAGSVGPTCVDSCPCRNGGQCKSMARRNIECECLPGLTGKLCETKWLTQERFGNLEDKVQNNGKLLGETNARVSELSASDKRVGEVQSAVDMVRTDLERKLAETNEKVRALVVKQVAVDTKLANVQGRLGSAEEKLKKSESAVANVNSRIAASEKKVGEVQSAVVKVRTDLESKLAETNEKVRALVVKQVAVDAKLANVQGRLGIAEEKLKKCESGNSRIAAIQVALNSAVVNIGALRRLIDSNKARIEICCRNPFRDGREDP